MTEPTELMPCPFCGGNARKVKHSAGSPGTIGYDRWHGVACAGCNACVGARDRRFRTSAAAIAAWNTRTPQPTQAQAGVPCRKNPFYHGPRNCSRGTVGCCEDHGAKPQSQSVAVPLTDEQIEALPMWKRFVGLWPETRREIVRTIERHHGIKGGQHGTE